VFARAGLPEPDDTLARLEACPPVGSEPPRGAHSSRDAPAPWDSAGDAAFRRLADSSLASPVGHVGGARVLPRRRVVALAAGVPALVALAVLVVSFWVQPGASPTALDPSIGAPPKAVDPGVSDRSTGSGTAKAKARSDRRPAARPARRTPQPSRGSTGAAAGSRRFAWAPSPGVSGYHVELFRGATLIFSSDTKRAEVVVPRTWRFGGRAERLSPGGYRWYVWPVVSGRRASQAIVQAKLDIRR
jgi:hypothetical protein